MQRTKFYIAEGSIKAFFKANSKKVYSFDHLETIFYENRVNWNIPVYMNPYKFIDRLISWGVLKKNKLEFEGYLNDKELYIANDASIFQIAVAVVNKAYLSHFSAAFIHNLTTQIPKTVYITFEQGKKVQRNILIEQKAIDNAFSKPTKVSGTKTVIDDYTLLIHNGMFTNRIGVYNIDDIPVTNIERTLIDITVRPNYAGGVFSVLEIYRNAIERVSINKLMAILDSISFTYPFHQAIGFYLEKAGWEENKLSHLKSRKMVFDFYLAHGMEEKEYSSTWRIYYPKGM